MTTSLSLPSKPSTTDPTPLFEFYRGCYGTELLAVALVEFRIFDRLKAGGLSFAVLKDELGISDRALNVLLTGLRAMGMLTVAPDQSLRLSELAAEHLVEGGDYYVGDYFARSAESAGSKEMAARLRSGKPRGSEDKAAGVGFLFREGLRSAMEQEAEARQFTLMLAGRAKNVAPVLAERLPLKGVKRLVDVGGGSGIYSVALLRQNPELTAVVWDRPEVLKVAADFGAQAGVGDRLKLVPGDMFKDAFPMGAEVALLSNILHDWDIHDAREIVRKCSQGLPEGGRIVVHDVFLKDDLSGPLAPALYSAHLYLVTEGRLYSALEVQSWLEEFGFQLVEKIPTRVHCSALVGLKVR